MEGFIDVDLKYNPGPFSKPELVIDRVLADRDSVLCRSGFNGAMPDLRIGPDVSTLQFRFAAPIFFDEQKREVQLQARRLRRSLEQLRTRSAERIHQPQSRQVCDACTGLAPVAAGQLRDEPGLHHPASVVPQFMGQGDVHDFWSWPCWNALAAASSYG